MVIVRTMVVIVAEAVLNVVVERKVEEVFVM